MKQLLPFLFLLNTTFCLAQSKKQNVETTNPILDAYEQELKKDIETKQIAGASYLLYHNGSIIRMKAFGESDILTHRALQTTDIFRLASMTKPIASLALLLLQEDGLINMNDRLEQYLPAFAHPNIVDKIDSINGAAVLQTHPAQKPILLRHLLTHTAGFASQYGGNLGALYLSTFKNPYTNDLTYFADQLAKLPLSHEPGDGWVYGPSINIAAKVIEVVTGMPFQDFLQKRIFDPLQMNDTRFYYDAAKADRLTSHYTLDANGQIKQEDPGSVASKLISGPKVYYSGSGGLNSTLEDYLKFCVMILNNGVYNGKMIAKPETIALMKIDQVPLNINADISATHKEFTEGFTFGYQIVRKNNARTPKTRGTISWAGATGPQFFIDPHSKTIAIYMIQMQPYTHVPSRKTFATAMLKAVN